MGSRGIGAMNPGHAESVSFVAGEVSAVRGLHDTGYRTTELVGRHLLAVGHCVGPDRGAGWRRTEGG